MSENQRSFPFAHRALTLYHILRKDWARGIDYSTKEMMERYGSGGPPGRWELICAIGKALSDLSDRQRGAVNRRWALWDDKWRCNVGLLRAKKLESEARKMGFEVAAELYAGAADLYRQLRHEYHLQLDRQEKRVDYVRGSRNLQAALEKHGVIRLRNDGLVSSWMPKDVVGDSRELAELMLGLDNPESRTYLID
jgi:hypothetical protein